MRAARAEIDLLISNPNYRAGRRLERGRLAKSLAESAKRRPSGALAPFSSPNPNPNPDPNPDPTLTLTLTLTRTRTL